MKIDRICLDLDGICCNFVLNLFKLLNKEHLHEEALKTWTPCEFRVHNHPVINITEDEMWNLIDNEGEKFWNEMPVYPYAKQLYEECLKIAPVYFLSSPSNHGSSLSGKLKWIQNFTNNKKFRNYLIGPKKELCANPNSILIDDYDRNTENWTKNGGHAILFPQIWNSNHTYQGDKVEYVISEIKKIQELDDNVIANNEKRVVYWSSVPFKKMSTEEIMEAYKKHMAGLPTQFIPKRNED